MRSKRTPDRVHVVRAPEQDTNNRAHSQASSGYSVEIVRMLAQIGDKLKRSEAERYELLNELREYRKSLRDLEDKNEGSEKAFLTLQNTIKTKGTIDTESLQRQARFEKTLKEAEDKIIKAIAGQAVIDKRLSDTENKQTMIDQRLDQSVTEQARLDRQLELTSQDKSRLLRKVERLEEIVSETQDTLRSKAMVLLTDQSATKGSLSAPAWSETRSQQDKIEQPHDTAWYKMASVQAVGLAGMVLVALLAGYMINQVQRPELPNIAVMDNGGLASLNQENDQWEPIDTSVNTDANIGAMIKPTAIDNAAGLSDDLIEQVSITADPVPENVLDYSDDQLMDALNEDPEALATQLNDIEPTAAAADEEVTSNVIADPKITAPMKDFDKLAYVQDSAVQKAIMSEKKSGSISSRLSPDGGLPDNVKDIESQAFAGNAEAQHDLAAIYTAGHVGVDQNFEKAAFWFREAADQDIPNARYNLGVLNHQGLGTERDLDKALYWYREAAKLGHAEAQYNLGIAHIEGIGTSYNPRLAAAFFEQAANNGVMEAAYNLGLIYENGLLGEIKPEEALLWYQIAAGQGSSEAKSAMEQLATSLQIDMNDVDNLVERMQKINESVKGRRAGPVAG